MKHLPIYIIVMFFGSTAVYASQWIKEGDAHFARGDFRRAGSLFETAVSKIDKEKEIQSYVYLCLKLAECYKALGYHKRALPLFKAAIPFLGKSESHRHKALFWAGLADLLLVTGEPEASLQHIKKALEHAKKANNPQVLALVLNAVGNLAVWSEDFGSALKYYDESLNALGSGFVAKELGINLLINRARVLALNGNSNAWQEAAKVLRKIKKLPDGYFKAAALLSAYTVANDTPGWKDFAASRDVLGNALDIAYKLGNAKLVSISCGRLGGLHEKAGRFKKAAEFTEKALFFARKSAAPHILYRWQWQMGRIFAARNDLKGAMEFYAKAIATLNPIRTKLFTGYRHKRDFFNAKVKPVYLGMAELLVRQASESADESAGKKLILGARDTMEILKTAELENFFQDECSAMTGKKRVKSNRTLGNAVLIYPISLEKRLVVLATFQDGMEYRYVNVTQRELAETAKRLRSGLQNRTVKTFVRDARRLYTWLIAPFETMLERYAVNTLVIAPDGVLRLIPFSTLYDGKRFLVEKYAVCTIPAVNLTDFGESDFAGKKHEILITGLSEGVQGFSALPGVKGELREINKIMGGSGFYADREHNLKNLQREFETKAYSMVHMSTHGVFGHNARNTFLLLYDGRLDMNALAKLLAPKGSGEKPVELLTLSACQTAMGDDRAALGLAGVAVKAGVKSVVATLWFVDDEATSFVIREFYRQLRRKLPKARALQNAQKILMAKKRYRHPAYWAPFLLIGDWR